jgi:hypothetical protein
MRKLIQLLAVCLTICGCSGAVLQIPEKIKPCGPPLGEYQVTMLGTLPDKTNPDMAPVVERLCPPDVYLGVKTSQKLTLASTHPLAACGTYMAVDKENGIVSMTTSTNTGISGIAVVRITITPELFCLAHFTMTYKLLP